MTPDQIARQLKRAMLAKCRNVPKELKITPDQIDQAIQIACKELMAEATQRQMKRMLK